MLHGNTCFVIDLNDLTNTDTNSMVFTTDNHCLVDFLYADADVPICVFIFRVSDEHECLAKTAPVDFNVIIRLSEKYYGRITFQWTYSQY